VRRHGLVGLTLGAVVVTLVLPIGAVDAAVNIVAVGGWSRLVNASDLIAGAGSDLVSVYESAANATLITITGGGNNTWRVDVRRTDSIWNGGFHLFVRRTGDGTGSKPVTGGLAYQEVTTTNVSLFSFEGNRSSIPIQYKLEGMSIAVPPLTYSTTVVFTVVQM